jgi:putative ABC transport system substrate-binding protein
LGVELGAKRLELLHELVPAATLIAVLVNRTGSNAEAFVTNVQVGARTLGLKIEVVHANAGGELEAKRLELLHQLVPRATRIAVLVNPADVRNTETTLREVGSAARGIGLQVQVLRASTAREIEEAFAVIGQERPDALFVGSAAFLNIRRVQLVQLATYHRLPATFSFREAAEAGALMSYGPSIEDAYRQWAIYAGRILKGAKPADLPVMQASKFELVINHPTARMLGIAVSDKLLATADEVID